MYICLINLGELNIYTYRVLRYQTDKLLGVVVNMKTNIIIENYGAQTLSTGARGH